MKRTWLIAAAAAHAAACSDQTTTLLPELNLDRPIDVSFACYGAMRRTEGGTGMPGQEVLQTAQPTAACEQLSPQITPDRNADGTADAIAPLPGQGTIDDVTPTAPKWYSFILQSTAGTVAIGSWHTRAADVTGSGQADPDPDAKGRFDFQVLDADPLTPGKNAIAIGEDPVAIGTDPSGCFALTANAGSCDLSELQINSVLDDLGTDAPAAAKFQLNRRPIQTASKKQILARPAAMVVQPGPTVADPTADPMAPQPDLSEAISKMGFACTQPTGVAYVAFPSCHVVAGVDLGTGTVVSGIQFDASGAARILDAAGLENLATSCPRECISDDKMPTTSDATPDVPRPVTLAYRFDPRVGTSRLAIGADNSNLITVLDIDRTGGFAPIGPIPPPIPLQLPASPANASRKLGVSSIALSPQIGIGGYSQGGALIKDGDSTIGQTQYVYAVANDATVRVVDVLLENRECDTQIDGRAVRANIATGGASALTVRDLACMKYATPTLPRRVGAKGPGISLPLSSAPGNAVPTSVAIVRGRSVPPQVQKSSTDMTKVAQSPAPSLWLGHFAVISSSTGDVYVANVDDDYAPDMYVPGGVGDTPDPVTRMKTAPVLVMAHQLRDGLTDRGATPAAIDPTVSSADTCHAVDPSGGVLSGGPRATTLPAQTVPLLSTGKTVELPTLLIGHCPTGTVGSGVTDTRISELQFGASPEQRDQVFPDLASVRSEVWTMTYESTLSLDGITSAVDGPPVRTGQIAVDKFGMTLTDPARPFCDMGVQPFDIVELRGCSASNGNNDCPKGYVCFVHPKSAVPIGACMLENEGPQLAEGCADFLTTQRVYTAGQAADGTLVLLERKHELPNTPVGGCDATVPDQCNELARLAGQIGAITDPNPFDTAQPPTKWECRHDSLRAPINADPAKDLRCVQTCTYVPKDMNRPADAVNCSAGSACLPDAPGMGIRSGTCFEGVEPPQACANGPQRYAVRASEAFTVIGALSGYVHPVIRQADGSCSVPSPASPTLMTGRIPLNGLPACGSDTGPNRPNPCVLEPVTQFDTMPAGPIDCSKDPETRTLQNRSAPAIEFRNAAMALTFVDPYKECNLPSGTAPVKVPMAPRGYQLQFEVRAGFQPFLLPLSGQTISPVKVLRGPSESIWVIDDGDYQSNSLPTRGKVFRLESTNVNAINSLE